MSDIKVTTDSGKFIAGARTDSGDHVGDLYVYHNGTNSFVENETGILYVTNKANANLILGTNNTTALTIDNSQKTSFAKPVSIIGAQAYASSATNLSESVSKMALRVQGSSDASTSLWMGALTNDAQQYIQSCNSAGDGADEIILNPFGGKVGVGVGNASPTALFEVKTDDENIARFDGLQGNIDFRYGSDIEFDRAGIVYITANNGSGELQLRTGGQNARLHIDEAGLVGIGTTSPGNNVHVVSTSSETGILVQSNLGGTGSAIGGQIKLALGARNNSGSGQADTQSGDVLGQIMFEGQGTDYSYQGGNIKTIVTTGDGSDNRSNQGTAMTFETIAVGSVSPAERMRIASNGNVEIDGDLKLKSGHKFEFEDSSTGTGMNDWEEGYHTYSITDGDGGEAWTNRSGYTKFAYTKVGRMVTVIGKFETSSADAARSGTMRISMPFTCMDGDDTSTIASGSITLNRYGGGVALDEQLTPIIFENTAYVNIQMAHESGGTESYVQAEDIDGTIEGQISITYFV